MTFIEFRKAFNSPPKRDFRGLKPFLKRGVNIIPADDPLCGEVGLFVFVVKGDKETAGNLTIKVSKKAEKKEISCFEEFNKVFDSLYNRDYPIELYDDPRERLCGFIVNKRSSRIWYCIKLIDMVEGQFGIGVDKPYNLVDIRCECGKEMNIVGKGWRIEFKGQVEATCPCGKVIQLIPPKLLEGRE
jgi:hypothetical protein